MWIAFVLGLLSSLHCAGMCGGIVAAATYGIPSRRFVLVLLGNAGRILSYATAGALVAAGAGGAVDTWFPVRGHLWLSIIAAVILIGAGLQLTGWLNMWSLLEGAAGRLWLKLQRASQHLLPLRTPSRALLFGVLWGWLPCGLVYSALAWAASSAEPWNGALTMIAFGLGTLPAVMGLGLFSARLLPALQKRGMRLAAGSLLVVLGTFSAIQNLQHLHHDHASAPPAAHPETHHHH